MNPLLLLYFTVICIFQGLRTTKWHIYKKIYFCNIYFIINLTSCHKEKRPYNCKLNSTKSIFNNIYTFYNYSEDNKLLSYSLDYKVNNDIYNIYYRIIKDSSNNKLSLKNDNDNFYYIRQFDTIYFKENQFTKYKLLIENNKIKSYTKENDLTIDYTYNDSLLVKEEWFNYKNGEKIKEFQYSYLNKKLNFYDIDVVNGNWVDIFEMKLLSDFFKLDQKFFLISQVDKYDIINNELVLSSKTGYEYDVNHNGIYYKKTIKDNIYNKVIDTILYDYSCKY